MNDNENRGSLFKNDKRGNDRAPDYTGKCIVGGAEMRIAAWVKETPNKPKFLSLKFTPADAPPAGGQQAPKPEPRAIAEEDLPF